MNSDELKELLKTDTLSDVTRAKLMGIYDNAAGRDFTETENEEILKILDEETGKIKGDIKALEDVVIVLSGLDKEMDEAIRMAEEELKDLPTENQTVSH